MTGLPVLSDHFCIIYLYFYFYLSVKSSERVSIVIILCSLRFHMKRSSTQYLFSIPSLTSLKHRLPSLISIFLVIIFPLQRLETGINKEFCIYFLHYICKTCIDLGFITWVMVPLTLYIKIIALPTSNPVVFNQRILPPRGHLAISEDMWSCYNQGYGPMGT